MHTYPYTITISSEKGGVGKTTLATNLAIYLKAMRDDLPVTVFSFDNHFTIDKMFEIGKRRENCQDVHALLLGAKGSDVVETGQYGVDFIRSSAELSDIHERFKGPMSLTRMLAESGLSGIVIIDTRPDLNILTQNALYAADRVLIPVKDLPSMENCKNIFALFDQRGIDKKSLALIPCLIDSRIKFDGLFKDQKTLLRGIAVNRGYRCLDTYISKSPKVESLATNPEGKIFPILTHARNTEVHSQFMEIARDMLRSIAATKETRACLYHTWLLEKESGKKESYLARLEGLAENCLICGSTLAEPSRESSFYFETSDRSSRGFLHSDCFIKMLCSSLYSITDSNSEFAGTKAFVAGKCSGTVSFMLPILADDGSYQLDFRQVDMNGNQILRKVVKLADFNAVGFGAQNDQLNIFLNETLAGVGGALRKDSWLVVYPVDPQNPQNILREEQYRSLQKIKTLFNRTGTA